MLPQTINPKRLLTAGEAVAAAGVTSPFDVQRFLITSIFVTCCLHVFGVQMLNYKTNDTCNNTRDTVINTRRRRDWSPTQTLTLV